MVSWSEPGFPGGMVSLRELIGRHGALSPRAALLVLRESLLSLAAAHEYGIVHQDYQPANVLIGRDGSSDLAGFGEPVPAGREAASRRAPYQAPELRAGDPASQGSNLYAATAVLFECLTGLAPTAERISQFKRGALAASGQAGDAFEPLCGLMARGMAADPAGRPASARELIAALDDMAGAAYGPDWTGEGRRELAGQAAATPAPGAAQAGGRLAGWLAARGRLPYAVPAAIAAVAVLGVTGTAFALSGHFGSQPARVASAVSQAAQRDAASSPPAGTPSARQGSAPPAGKAATPGATVRPAAATTACASPGGAAAPAACTRATGTQKATGTRPAPGTRPAAAARPAVSIVAAPAGEHLVVNILSDQVTPGTVPCGSAPPTYGQLAQVTSNEAIPAQAYHWVRPDGTVTPTATMILNAGATSTTSDRFTPSSDTFSGTETLVLTSPVQGSWSIPLALSCSAAPTPSSKPLGIFNNMITATGVALGTINVPYSVTDTPQNGTGPFTWSATGLPPGLTINAATGKVSGTPTAAGGFSVRVTLKDSESPPQTAFADSEMLIGYPQIGIRAATVPNGTAGTPYPSVQFSAYGGDGVYTWHVAVDTKLPPGLTLSPGGLLSGTPTTAGTYRVGVTVFDGESSPAAWSAGYTVVISAA